MQVEHFFSDKQSLLKKVISFQSLLSQFSNSQVRHDLSNGTILPNYSHKNLLEDIDKLRNILQPRYEGLVYVRDAKCEVAAAHCVALMDKQDAPFSLSDASHPSDRTYREWYCILQDIASSPYWKSSHSRNATTRKDLPSQPVQDNIPVANSYDRKTASVSGEITSTDSASVCAGEPGTYLQADNI